MQATHGRICHRQLGCFGLLLVARGELLAIRANVTNFRLSNIRQQSSLLVLILREAFPSSVAFCDTLRELQGPSHNDRHDRRVKHVTKDGTG